jgi:hypothetical protein
MDASPFRPHVRGASLDDKLRLYTQRNENGCLIWTAGLSGGRPQVRLVGVGRQQVHRLVWARLHGEIPAGTYVYSVCGNPRCVEVEHLRERADRRKNICKRGHPRTPENLYVSFSNGQRFASCKTCRRLKQREYARVKYNIPPERYRVTGPVARRDTPSPTVRQLQVLSLLADGWRTFRPHSIRSLGEALRIRSTNGISDHLKALERKGFIERERMRAKALRLTEAGWKWADSAMAAAFRTAAPEVAQ